MNIKKKKTTGPKMENKNRTMMKSEVTISYEKERKTEAGSERL